MDKLFRFRVRLFGIIAILIIAAEFYDGISYGIKTILEDFKTNNSEQSENTSSDVVLDSDDVFFDIVLIPDKSLTSLGKNRGLIKAGNVSVLLSKVDIKAIKAPQASLSIMATQTILLFSLMGLLIWMIAKVWGIVGAIGRGELLKPKTFVSLRTIGAMIIVIELFSIAYSYLEVVNLRSFVKIDGYTIGLDYSLCTLLFGIILMLFGEVLAYSTRIKAEQELTI